MTAPNHLGVRPAAVFQSIAVVFLTAVGLALALSFVVLRRREPTMERSFRAPGGTGTGVVAVVLTVGPGVLSLFGMPAALVWPCGWVLLAVRWALGLGFLGGCRPCRPVRTPRRVSWPTGGR